VYRSNHFESQNVGQGLSGGQGLAGDQSSAQRPNKQMPFTSSVQAIDTNGHNQLSQVLHSQHLATPNLQRPDLAAHQNQNFAHDDAGHHSAPRSLAARMEQGQLAQREAVTQDEHLQNKPDIDPQISALFSAMGKASQLSHSQLAARLQTSPVLISALENGSLNDLPRWEEIEPVIRRYAEFMNIDDRAILRRLREQLTEHYLTNMTADKKANMTGALPFQNETPPPLKPEHSHNNTSIMPSSDMSLKAFANGNLTSNKSGQDQNSVSGEMNAAHSLHNQSIEERFTALTSAVTSSQNSSLQNSSHIPTQTQPLDTRSALTGYNNTPPHMNGYGNAVQMNNQGHQPLTGNAGQQANLSNPQFLNTAPQQENRVPVALGHANAKPKIKWMRIFGNFALIMILLVGFINWQPNRFWSGVDQLPKPISKSIYTLFEFVMPDPLASVYRMNWVHVADPRMRKTDKLSVPTVRKLPRIDFSKLGSLNN
jgi:hypothetical protein